MRAARRAFVEGLASVAQARGLLFALYVATLAVPLPLTLAMWKSLDAQIGATQMAETAATGADFEWWQALVGQAAGMAAILGAPNVVGFAAPLDNLSSLVDAVERPRVVTLVALVYGLLWMFLWGGVLDRYASGRLTSLPAFLQSGAAYFFRFLRFGVLAGIVYLLLFGPVHRWLFGYLYTHLADNVVSERAAFLWRTVLYATFGALFVGCNLVFDYTKIRMVIEQRRSVTGAVLAGLRFVGRHPVEVLQLYLLNGLVFVTSLAGYWAVAPGVGAAGLGIVRALVIGQAYVLARLVVRLTFAASQTKLFQSS